jgi:energy-coupling factor transport system ATP-binding protein
MDNNPMVQINELIFEYKSHEEADLIALNGVDLQVQRGEHIVIIGHNGSGKSTLAKHMNALLLPTSGDVLIAGMNTRDPERLWEIRQTAGMVFQNPDNQIVATIVEEDVAFGPENLGIAPALIAERVAAALKRVDMSDFSTKAPHLLSGGQKQRIAIAGVIAMRPDCIIFDEPTAMLDPSGRKEVINAIKTLNREEKITVIHITHFMEEAVNAGRVVVMEDGRIVMQGTPREIFARVNELKSLGLDVPQMTELAAELSNEGIDLPKDILTVEEMVTHLCRLKSKT